MGMFDYVQFEFPCPGCDIIIDDWQSKDGECILSILKPIDVKWFYSCCDDCELWIDFQLDNIKNYVATYKMVANRVCDGQELYEQIVPIFLRPEES